MNVFSRDLAARALPQLNGSLFLTDGGMETVLVFHEGFDLPLFAVFPLLKTEEGRAALTRYFESFLDLAAAHDAGFILETPTWRASRDWGEQMGLSADEIVQVNRDAVTYLEGLRARRKGNAPIVISGCIGPRGDGYRAENMMTADEAEAYHSHQIGTFAATGADMVSALTLTYAAEAVGIVRAAQRAGIPAVIAFTVETDGRLPSGQSLEDAIREVDEATGSGAAYFMVNCAHPTHFEGVLEKGALSFERIHGIRANSSRCSHAELDEAEELDEGNPVELGAEYQRLRKLLPNLNVVGGCCGTDLRHVREIARAWAS